MTRCARTAAAALAVAALLGAQAPPDTAAIAAAVVRAQAPADDDPEAVAADLLSTALAHRRSPVAVLAVGEVHRLLDELPRAAVLRSLLPADGERQHGLLHQSLELLRWRLDRRERGPQAAGPLPTFGHVDALVAWGPFGDAGDAFVGVVFAPELRLPAADELLPGRGRPARMHVATRRAETRMIRLSPPPRHDAGCWYGAASFEAAHDLDAFVELEHHGDCQLFVDGREVLRLERWRRTAAGRHHVALHLPAGRHEVLVKTAANGTDAVALRCVDADGHAAAGVAWLAPGAAAPAAGAPATATAAMFQSALEVLARAAERSNGSPEVRIAAVLAAAREGHGDLAIDLAEPLRQAPPAAGPLALAWAQVLRLVPLPDERRKAEARALEEGAVATLPPAHHAATMARVGLLAEQDQREAALKLLAGRTGPQAFAQRLDLLRQLRFGAEVRPLLQQWAEAIPHDPRPWAALADDLQASHALPRLLVLRRQSLQRSADQPGLAAAACRHAIATGDGAAARELLDLAQPVFADGPSVARLRLELEFATATGDGSRAAALRQQLAGHPDADAALLVELAGQGMRSGDPALAQACLAAAMQRGDHRPAVAEWAARLAGQPGPGAAAARWHRDGRAAATAFVAGDRERTAATTVVLDQRVLVVHDDGSWTAEGHELRRINDPAGVEAFGARTGLGSVDEVLLVRTLGTDGKDYVPARIDGDYAMQRLEPGAFVEWRWREHGRPPEAAPLDAGLFLFGSADAPCANCELVVVLPTDGDGRRRGELRTRQLGPPDATETLPDGRTAHVWTRIDLPALAQERFRPPPVELLPCAHYGEDEPPFATLRAQRVQLGRRTRTTAPIAAAAAAATAGIADPRAKAEAIWAWCQQHVEDGSSDQALDTLLRRQGSRFLLAVALLRAVGLPVAALACAPVRPELGDGPAGLFATDDALQLPGAVVTLPDGTRLPLFVDAPRHWPLGAVPAQRLGTTATIVHDTHAEPLLLTGGDAAAQSVQVRGTAALGDDGYRLEVDILLGDVAGFALAERMRQLPDTVRRQAARQITQQLLPGWRVDAAAVAPAAPGTPLLLRAALTRAGGQADGDRIVLPLPLPPDRLMADFGDRAERTLPWRLAVDLSSDWRIVLDPGPDRVVALPPPVAVNEPPLRFDQQVLPSDGGLVVRRLLRIGAGTRPAADFAAWLRALATVDRAQQATIALERRAR